MIDSVRSTVLSVLNKNNYGYLSPSDFNLLAKQAQLDIFKQYIHDYNYNIRKENNRVNSEGLANVKELQEKALDLFSRYDLLTQSSGNIYILPSEITTGYDWYKINRIDILSLGVYYSTSEYVTQDRAMLLSASPMAAPTMEFPSHSINGNLVTMYPAVITGPNDIKCQYIRYPKAPKWTYSTLSGGQAVFNESQPDYQDFEVPVADENELVERILMYAGVSIRELQVTQFANGIETQAKTTEDR